MAVSLFTSQAKELLSAIKDEIRQRHILTWEHSVHNGTDYFTHVTADGQWKNKAYFKPTIGPDRLTLNLVRPQNGSVPRPVYAVYHGRIIEMVIDHFPNLFSAATGMPYADHADQL